jgi:uncharacterized membrane protein
VIKKTVNLFLWFYLILSSLVFIFLLPPYQKYDETPHFARAVALASGQFFCHNGSFSIPLDLGELHRQFNFQKVLLENEKFPLSKIDFTKIRNSDKNKTELVGGCGMNFLGYLPNTIGVLLGLATNRYFYIFYLGRIFAFIFFLITFILSLKIIHPKFKYLLWFYALTPLVVHQVTAYSYDVVILSLIPILTALFVNLLENKKLSFKSWVAVWLIIIIIGIIKIVYFPLILLFLLVTIKPINLIRSFSLLLFASVIVFMVARLGNSTNTYTPFVNPTIQKQLIFHDPIYFLSALANTLINNSLDDYKSTVAVFGWKNALPSSDSVYYLYFFAIIWLIQKTFRTLSFKNNPIVPVLGLIIISGIVFAIYLAMYLVWSVVGDSTIKGVQGRYYLPFLPFVLIFLSQLWPYFKSKLFVGLVLLALFTSAHGLYLKYFDYSTNFTNPTALDSTIAKITKTDKLDFLLIDKPTTIISPISGPMIAGFKINLDSRNQAILIPYKFQIMDSICQNTLRSGYLKQYDIQADNIYIEKFSPVMSANSLCLKLSPLTFGLTDYNTFLSIKTLNSKPLFNWLSIGQ